jgi:hypothetical protein
MRVFPDEICIWIGGLSEADHFPKMDEHHFKSVETVVLHHPQGIPVEARSIGWY